MSGFRLSLQAEKTLTQIIGWTIDQFGVDQAISYKDQLITRLSCLAKNEMPHGRMGVPLESCKGANNAMTNT